MDEPHIPTAIVSSEGEKPEIDEVLDAAFPSDQLEKPMDVDESFPTTSSAIEPITESIIESSPTQESEVKSGEEEAGTLESDANQTIEQVNFEKDSEDSTIVNNTLDYTERSINISQIDCENQDDSNDAFNALKRDETDVLNEMKEEPAESVEKSENDTPMETDDSAQPSSSPPPANDDNPESTLKPIPEEEVENSEMTEKIAAENDESEPVEMETQTDVDLGSIEEVDKGVDEEGGDKEESTESQKPSEDTENVQSPSSETTDKPVEEIEDEEAETTNEGKLN
jgi:hypothetical protein